MTVEQLEKMGHKHTWTAVIWGKLYLFMKDHEGGLYMCKVNEDGTLAVL